MRFARERSWSALLSGLGWIVVAQACFIATAKGQSVSEQRQSTATAQDIVRLVATASSAEGTTILEFDRGVLSDVRQRSTPFVVERFPLRPGVWVDLELTPFSITSPRTRFVLGRKGQPDQPLDFDPSRIALFRGKVAGRPGSHVFLALSDRTSTGRIDLGVGAQRYGISSKDHRGVALGSGRVSVFETVGVSGQPAGVPLCGVEGQVELNAGARLAEPSVASATSGLTDGLKQLELAVETDFEFFSLFGNADAAAEYLVEMYAQVSDIYMRDVNTRVELVFARIWDDPDDLFNDPGLALSEFLTYWNTNMGHVQRDAAQLFSGRRDYPFGGIAFLNALCSTFAYSVVGYATGFFPDPSLPSPLHYDIAVTAHELGHNSGTVHTHDPPLFLDTCHDPNSTPRRGPIMSYCGQTWSGLNANRDLYFHTRIRQEMRSFINNDASCVVNDCNTNSIDDALDISQSTSADVNADGIPDECQDCNGNGQLDDFDIAGPISQDLNANGVPDECEPDCNANNIPDDMDIAAGTSTDAYGNGIPDECETDCNGNNISDYTEIQANMPLDVDRNARLDACQDCDGDGTPDLQALGGAHNLWIASGLKASVLREFHATAGVLTRSSSGAVVNQGQDVIVVPDGRVLVSSAGDHRVMEFDASGNYLGDLVSPGAGGLAYPTGLLSHPDGRLLVASRDTNNILAYDGADGTFLGAFVESGSGGLVSPFGLTLGPNGNLFVTSAGNEVFEFDSETGALIGVFVNASNNGGLASPRGLVFKPDGNLLVASFATNEVLEFDGETGAPLGKWAQVGTSTRLTQVSPWGIRIGPNGNVFVARTGEDFGSAGGASDQDSNEDDVVGGGSVDELHLTDARIYEFDVRTGLFVRTHIGGNDHGLLFPTGFDFIPGWNLDCNLNLLPDSCDVASGFSDDGDANGIPDECELDCNANGVLDRIDLIPFGSSFDCNANLVPDECDVIERDCNGNNRPDDCDVADGTSPDENNNGVPDECDRQPPGVPGWPHDWKKNRYVSFTPDNSAPTAFEVSIAPVLPEEFQQCMEASTKWRQVAARTGADPCSLQITVEKGTTYYWWFVEIEDKNGVYCSKWDNNSDCFLDFEDYPVGEPVHLGWVSAPFDPGCEEDDGTPKNPPQPCAGEAVARVVKEPVFRIWTEPHVHVGDCEIVPVASYRLRATADAASFSQPLTLETIAEPEGKFWGDVVGSFTGIEWSPPNRLVNVDDVVAWVSFVTQRTAPHLTALDLDGEVPNYVINATDLQLVLKAFLGESFPPPAFPNRGSPTNCP